MDTSRGIRSLVRIFLVAAVAGGVSSVAAGASAAVVPSHLWSDGGGNTIGNGKHNRTAVIINSPGISRDVQHVRNVNVGGKTVTPAAVCFRFHHCKIIQRTVVDDPW